MKIFAWVRRNRVTINGVLITVFTSLIFNKISDAEGNVFKDYKSIATEFLQVYTLSGLLILLSLVGLIIFNLCFVIARYRINKKTLSKEFPDLMRKYTSPQLVDSVGNGCLSWGEGKTVEICNDIIFGWNPESILLEDYENEQYRFYSSEEVERKFGGKSYYFNNEDYIRFMNSDAFQEVIRKGNNLSRFMLRRCTKNFDKNNRKLLLSIGRTEWSQTS